MTYKNALEYIHSAKRISGAPTLERMKKLMSMLGNPERRLRFVHIAGTNGKGSAAAMTASVLKCAGYRTGLYISPYINDFCERMSICGEMIDKKELAALTEKVRKCISTIRENEKDAEEPFAPVEFEIVTAIAFLYFEAHKCDIVVLECGLGGRYDATNVILPPEVAVIMNIGLDHTELLGDTYEKIAAEKCGIIKSGCGAVVSYPQNHPGAADVISRDCAEKRVDLIAPDVGRMRVCELSLGKLVFEYKGEEYCSALTAGYQVQNALTVIETVRKLSELGFSVPESCIAEGLAEVRFPARFELFSISPAVIVDGAHNPDGMRMLASSADAVFGLFAKGVHLVIGMLADKDVRDTLMAFRRYTNAGGEGRMQIADILCLPVNSPRAMDPSALAKIAEEVFTGVPVKICRADGDKAAALFSLIGAAGERDAVLVTGSLYLAGEIRAVFKSRMMKI